MKTKFLLFRRKSFGLLNVGLIMVLFSMNLQGQITQVGTATKASSGTSTAPWGATELTILKPDGIEVGDIMIANISQVTNWSDEPKVTVGTPASANWIQIATNDNLGGIWGVIHIGRGTILYKIADEDDANTSTTSYAFALGNNFKAAGAIVAFREVNKDNPFITQDIGTLQVTQMNTNYICSGITISVNNAMVVMIIRLGIIMVNPIMGIG